MRFALVLLAGGMAAAETVSFEKQVLPILAQRCQFCHSGPNRSGQISFANHREMMESGVVAAGRPNESRLLSAVTGRNPKMPKGGAPLSSDQIATLRRWIAEGAKSDGGSAPQLWWSRRPLVQPAVPQGFSHPIDAFLRTKFKEKNLAPSPEADRRTLIRRLTFDLHGLPPTPEEVKEFLSDASPDAYGNLVTRLLDSPRYGERWARHWLDVVHYGDSHGYDKDKPRPNAWPYRDWVIQALNSDKPYARFVEEQLAGDVLAPDDPNSIVATGFLAAGPWDFVGHQELREGTTDKEITRLLDRDDMVATTMSAFVSQTVHCARCHNHKFDPISQEDYYRVQAVFAGVDRADRPIDRNPDVSRKRRALLEERRKVQIALQPLLDKVDNASSPELDQLDFRIRDARAQATHIGTPKTPEETEQKRQLLTRAAADAKRREEVLRAFLGASVFAEIARLTAEAKRLDEQMAILPKPEYVYAAASYFPRAGTFRPALRPRPIHLLQRGNVNAPGPLVAPGAIGTSFDLADPDDEAARRLALALWITDSKNPLTWRAIVNRAWHYHFGAGLVDSPNDFGRMGAQPSHPELLDWLAVWFRDEAGGSLKKLHRLIVTSAAYRQTSKDRPEASRIDAENRFLWRMNRSRLDAESVRDAMLAVSGKIDLTEGGPPVQMFYFKDDHSPVYDYSRFDLDSEGAYRRSIYRFIVRSVPDPFMERLDCPDPSVLTAKRNTTLTAIQALALLNNRLVIRLAEHFAAQIEYDDAPVQKAYRLAFGRDATPAEEKAMREFAAKQGWANFCRLLFNANEFLFVD